MPLEKFEEQFQKAPINLDFILLQVCGLSKKEHLGH